MLVIPRHVNAIRDWVGPIRVLTLRMSGRDAARANSTCSRSLCPGKQYRIYDTVNDLTLI